MSPPLESLTEIEAALWRELETAAKEKTHAWRTPVLATIDNDIADARVVVLREVVEHDRHLLFYSDERAGKVSQLREHSRGTVVMWSPALVWQLRCRVRLTLETSGLSATSRWARIQPTAAAKEYLSPLPPGAALPAARQYGSGAVPRAFFAVIDAEIERMDWLELAPSGNRRALFDASGARWVQP